MSSSETKIIKRKKLSIKKILILLLVLYLIGCFIYYIIKLPIKTIRIEGTSLLKDYEIIEIAGIKNYPSIFKTNTNKITKKLQKLLLINDVKIKKDILGNLIITIKENKVLFFNRDTSSLTLEDKSEIKFTEEFLGVPILVNLIPDKIFEVFISKLKDLDYSVLSLISEIKYDPLKSGEITIDDTRFQFRMNDGNIVYINTPNIIELNNYIELCSPYTDKLWILNLDSTTDVFIFTPADQVTNQEEE